MLRLSRLREAVVGEGLHKGAAPVFTRSKLEALFNFRFAGLYSPFIAEQSFIIISATRALHFSTARQLSCSGRASLLCGLSRSC
jgi:hypothetical protein